MQDHITEVSENASKVTVDKIEWVRNWKLALS